jgi:hypothetical protein
VRAELKTRCQVSNHLSKRRGIFRDERFYSSFQEVSSLKTGRETAIDKMRQITSAAAKSGVVIYSMDTRGLVASLQDASSSKPFDPFGQLSLSEHSELSASQDGLNALAADTGGKASIQYKRLEKRTRAGDQRNFHLLSVGVEDPIRNHKNKEGSEISKSN